MAQSQRALVNTSPDEIAVKKDVSLVPIHAYWKSPHVQPKFTRHLQTLRPVEDDVNVLVLGPTGAGKSSVVNMLFNQKVAEVKASAMSVTRQMEVYQGFSSWQGEVRQINIIDSVGFCDSVIPAAEVLRLVK